MLSLLGKKKSYKLAQTLLGEAAGDRFGFDTALSGDGNVLVVGAWRNDAGGADAGRIYIYVRSNNLWVPATTATFNGSAAANRFGISVAVNNDGSTIAAGQTLDQSAGVANGGSVRVFQRSTGTNSWTLQTTLFPSPVAANMGFGNALAFSEDGNTLAVGASLYDIAGAGGNDVGAVYVFTRSGSTWSQQQLITRSVTGGADQFGAAVAITKDGNLLAIGCPRRASTDYGEVHIYTRSAGVWSLQTTLTASTPQTDDLLGASVALNGTGTILAAGMPQFDSSGVGSGDVLIFYRTGSSWSSGTPIITGPPVSQRRGADVTINASGNRVAIGMPDFSPGGYTALSVISETGSPSVWLKGIIINSFGINAGNESGFGLSMDNTGDILVIGDHLDDTGALSDRGAVRIFVRR